MWQETSGILQSLNKGNVKQADTQHALDTSETTQTAIKVFKKGKVFPVHARKAYWGSRGITPLILNLRTRWR